MLVLFGGVSYKRHEQVLCSGQVQPPDRAPSTMPHLIPTCVAVFRLTSSRAGASGRSPGGAKSGAGARLILGALAAPWHLQVYKFVEEIPAVHRMNKSV